jgi:putative ABC transport system substrate-binding protein
VKRREFITLLGGATAALPLAARAQQGERMRRIGVLMNLTADDDDASPRVTALAQGLQQLGWTVGRNLRIDYRWGAMDAERARRYAPELIALAPEVILAVSAPAVAALQQATRTGTTFLGPELVAKRLQLLRDVIPGLSRVAALWHPRAYSERTMAGILKEVEAAAQTLGLQLHLVPAVAPDEFAGAFSAMTSERADAFIVLPSPMLFGEYRQIVSLAASSRLPAMYQAREFVDAGGLMSYGANLPDLFRRTATYVDKILKGAKPADLPVEQPTKFELVINLKTARELGLTITRDFLLVADEVIE